MSTVARCLSISLVSMIISLCALLHAISMYVAVALTSPALLRSLYVVLSRIIMQPIIIYGHLASAAAADEVPASAYYCELCSR